MWDCSVNLQLMLLKRECKTIVPIIDMTHDYFY